MNSRNLSTIHETGCGNRPAVLLAAASVIAIALPVVADITFIPVKPVHRGSKILQNDELTIEIMDPDAAERYNTGVRFTPVAAVIRAVAGGREYLMHLPDPDPLKDVAGLFGEFDLVTPPPGFEEAVIGQPFVKIGVGALVKGKETYQFYVPHEVARLAITKVTWNTTSARFVQSLPAMNGYGYELLADVALSGRTLTIGWKLKNIGTKPFETHQYLHNSFSFDNAGLKPDTVVALPFDFKARGLAPEQRQIGREIRFVRELPGAVNIEVDYPEGYVGPNTLRVCNPETDLFVDCKTSIPGTSIALHASAQYVCPEQFVVISLQPGDAKFWTRSYLFGTTGEAGRCP